MRREAVEGQRRSARISALEEKARLLALERLNKSPSPSSSPPLPTRRRGRKRKSLQAFGFFAFPPWDGEEPRRGERMESTFAQMAHFEPLEPMPSIEVMEFILDILQRKDTQEMFAQPVDPDKVPNYYSVIKEPMDFGTMRAKLHEQMYKDFSQFEHDLLLIADNAVKFYDPNSIHYYEAVEIGVWAIRTFRAIREEPEKFYVELTRTRRRPRKASTEANWPSSSKHSKPNRRRFNSIYGGSRGGGSPLNSSPIERRITYTQSSSLTENDKILSQVNEEPKKLIPVKLAGGGYGGSLMGFAKDLGPTIQMAAKKKLLGKTPMEALSYPLQNPHSNILSKSFYRSVYDGLRLENNAIKFGGETYNNMVSVNGGTIRIGEEINNFEGKKVCASAGEIKIGGQTLNSLNYRGNMGFGCGIADHNYYNYKRKMVFGGDEARNNHNYFNEKMGFGYDGGIRNGQELANNNYGHGFNFKEKMGFGGEMSTGEETDTAEYDLNVPHHSNVDLLIASLLQIGSENKFNPSGSYSPLIGSQKLPAESQPPPPPSTTLPPLPLSLFPPPTITVPVPAPTLAPAATPTPAPAHTLALALAPAPASTFLKYQNGESGHNINVAPAIAPAPTFLKYRNGELGHNINVAPALPQAPTPALGPNFLKYCNRESGHNINVVPAPAPAPTLAPTPALAPAFLKYQNGESGHNINVAPAQASAPSHAFLKYQNGEWGANNIAPGTSRRPSSAPFWSPAKSSPSPLSLSSCQVNNVGGGQCVKAEESFWMNAKRCDLMQSMRLDLNL